MKDKGYNADLLIVGEGYYKKNLLRLVGNLGLKSSVKFLGSMNHGNLARAYNKADIFVLANFQEITPAVNEALACGLPIVVMECGGREFMIPNKSFGLICKRFDVEDMAKKVELLIKNRKMMEHIAKNGRERILKNFSIETVAEKFYKSFIN